MLVSERRRLRMFSRGLAVVLAIALGCVAVHGLVDDVRAIAFPYQLDYGEGPLLDQAMHLARGDALYRADLAVPPLAITNYPPVYVALLSACWRVFGPALWYGRALSLVAALVTAWLLAKTLHRLTHARFAAVIAGTIFLTTPYVCHWASLARVDLVALAMSWGAIALVVCDDRAHPRVWPAALLVFLAIFTKQTYVVAAPVTVFAWLWSGGQRRAAWRFAALAGGAVAAAFAFLDAYTHGGFFVHVIRANANRYDLSLLLHGARSIATDVPVLVIATIAAVVVAGRGRAPVSRVLVPYLIGSIATASLIGKIGSSTNYLLELAAALAFGTGALVAALGASSVRKIALTVALLAQAAMLVEEQDTAMEGTDSRMASRDGLMQLRELVRDSPAVLVDEWTALLPLDGRPITFQPFEMTQCAAAGLWSDADLISQIRDQRFDIILIYAPFRAERWTASLARAIEDHYRVVETIALTSVYRRR
jgi:Dolichyl-phosphate-mannose-protein mannosyltransferase